MIIIHFTVVLEINLEENDGRFDFFHSGKGSVRKYCYLARKLSRVLSQVCLHMLNTKFFIYV